MKYSVYKDIQQLWRWRLVAANGKTIADSGESYHNKADCLAGINLVKSTANTPVYEPPGS